MRCCRVVLSEWSRGLFHRSVVVGRHSLAVRVARYGCRCSSLSEQRTVRRGVELSELTVDVGSMNGMLAPA